MRRAAKVDANHGAIVEALLSVSGVTVHSLAGVGCGCPDLLVGAKGKSYLVEIKDGEKYPSRRMLTPEQRRWIERWTGSEVRILKDTGQATSWARRITAADDDVRPGALLRAGLHLGVGARRRLIDCRRVVQTKRPA